MLLLLLNEERQRRAIRGIIGMRPLRLPQEIRPLAALAELDVGEGAGQFAAVSGGGGSSQCGSGRLRRFC